MPALYMTEPARSSRGKCKKSKEPITKGEVRIGKGYERDEIIMWSWYKPCYFPLPKKELKELGGDIELWVSNNVTGFEDLEKDQKAALVADLGASAQSKKNKAAGGSASLAEKQKRKLEEMDGAVGVSPSSKK